MVKFEGHSGSKFIINGNKVTKISPSPEQNSRLQEQYEKMKKREQFRYPLTYQSYFRDNKFHYVMDVIQGQHISDFLLDNPTETCIDILFSIVADITCIDFSSASCYNEELIKKKIKFLDRQELLELCPWNDILATPSHGDMTLENIIFVNKNNYFYIDPLTSFEGYEFDLGKLYFDLSVGWSIRDIDNLSIIIKYQRLKEEFEKLFTNEKLKKIKRISLFQLARVIPYIKVKTWSLNLEKYYKETLKSL